MKKHPTWGGKRPNQTGRPPKPEAERRINRPIGFTQAEWEAIDEAAYLTGKSKAQIVRDSVARLLLEIASTQH